jgi:hypothetical protein
MRTLAGKIQIRNRRLGPGVFNFEPNVAAVINAKYPRMFRTARCRYGA